MLNQVIITFRQISLNVQIKVVQTSSKDENVVKQAGIVKRKNITIVVTFLK